MVQREAETGQRRLFRLTGAGALFHAHSGRPQHLHLAEEVWQMAVSCPKCAANFSKKPVNVLDSPEFSIFLGFIARLVAQGMSPEDSVRAAIAAGFSLAHAAARTEGTLTASKLRRLRRRASTRAAAVSAVAAIVASAARGGEAAAESARAQQERAAEQAALEQAQQARAAEQAAREAAAEAARAQQERAAEQAALEQAQQARAAEQAAREAAAEAARAQQERAAEQAARESAQAQQERAAEQVARDAARKERLVREAAFSSIHGMPGHPPSNHVFLLNVALRAAAAAAKHHGLVGSSWAPMGPGSDLSRVAWAAVTSHVLSLDSEPRAESSSATSTCTRTRSRAANDRTSAPVSAVGASSRRSPSNKHRR